MIFGTSPIYSIRSLYGESRLRVVRILLTIVIEQIWTPKDLYSKNLLVLFEVRHTDTSSDTLTYLDLGTIPSVFPQRKTLPPQSNNAGLKIGDISNSDRSFFVDDGPFSTGSCQGNREDVVKRVGLNCKIWPT